jgi:3-phenylpropionate/trans-cinnamate dioxygenase ferredoxin reductase subunit
MMAAPATFVIAGGGLAAAKAAEALRTEGFDGRIVVIGKEPHLPYERPPLSKDYLLGTSQRDKIFVHDEAWYRDQEIDLRRGIEVTGIDRAARQVILSDGARVGYDKLLLATGATPRRLSVPGHDRDTVRYLRTVDDSDLLRETLEAANRIAVIGGGWIGLETAAAARAADVEVTVIEGQPQPLQGVLGPKIGAVFADLHRDHGVELRLGARLAEVTATGVRLDDGSHVDADAVVAGIGAIPNTGLAAAAGLVVADGIETTAGLRTSDPDIFAAGDVAGAYHPLLGRHVRVEHWANALNQPAVAAQGMLGRPAVYDRLPYFYTDQYDLGMEYTGYAPPGLNDDVLVRGDVADREFIAFWLRHDGGHDTVIAAMNVNIWDVTDQLQELIRSAAPVDRHKLADSAISLDHVTRS